MVHSYHSYFVISQAFVIRTFVIRKFVIIPCPTEVIQAGLFAPSLFVNSQLFDIRTHEDIRNQIHRYP